MVVAKGQLKGWANSFQYLILLRCRNQENSNGERKSNV